MRCASSNEDGVVTAPILTRGGESIPDRVDLQLDKMALAAAREGMIRVVNSFPAGTGTVGHMDEMVVAGKTGTAQWGPKDKERTAAWFGGFVPAEHPLYAFAALYEADVGSTVHGGSAAAPMIGQILRDIYKETANEKNRIRRAVPVQASPSPEETDVSD